MPSRKLAFIIAALVASASPALSQGGGGGGAGSGAGGASSGGSGAAGSGGRSGVPVATPANPTFSGQGVPPATSTTNPSQNSLQQNGFNNGTGSNAGISSSSAGSANGTATSTNGAPAVSTQPANGNASAAQLATTGQNTLPQSVAPGAVSAPGVGVGHAANGLPIGSPGSGPGSPEQPIGSGKTSTR